DVNVSYIVGSTNTSTGGDTGDGGDTGGEGGGEEQPEEGNGTGAIYTGKTINGTLGDTEFTLAWTATWNKNETVTFSANINPTMPGMSPQILGLEENPVVLQLESGLYVYTTTATYKADEQIAANFFIAGENGVVSETMPFTYTVGSDANDNTGTGGGTEITPPAEGDKGNGETATGTILGVFEGATLPGEESTSDVAYEIVWSATWNLNGTVTFSFTITPWVVGLVPQISVGGSQFADLVSEGDNKYSFTTTGEYAEGTSPFALYMPYLGGVANVKMDYEVGASKDYTAIYRFDSSSTNAPVEFFNLAGQRVANPQHGVFIRKQGNKTSKVVIR
ncbi:MAG: hypothetical protein J1D77_08445, partial [Muribaculaceae bacterium]|nr:hypothetical protein [Muribaculaceae bacterium]